VLQAATDDAASDISFGVSLCLTPTFDLSSKRGPVSSYATAGVAFRVTGILKTPHHDTVEPPTRRFFN
jgi:hypothetical protein